MMKEYLMLFFLIITILLFGFAILMFLSKDLVLTIVLLVVSIVFATISTYLQIKE
jgi:hypothetical protein